MNIENRYWIVHGTEPVNWSIPFREVGREDKSVVVVPAMHLGILQAKAVTVHMSARGKREGETWRLSQTALARTASLIPEGAKPEEYFAWERIRAVPRYRFNPPVDPDRKAFLDWVHQQGFCYPFAQRRPEVELLWNQFSKAALDWLINEERPVDMYFVKLHNWPWRTNWRERIRRETKRYGLTPPDYQMFTQKPPTLAELEQNETLRFDMNSGTMFHMVDAFTCLRCVEVEITHGWWRVIKRVERERWKMLKAEGYAKSFLASAQRQWPIFCRILQDWMANCLHPGVAILPSGAKGRYRFIPRLRGLVAGQKLRQLSRDALAAAYPSLPRRTRASFEKFRKTIALRKLCALRREAKDLRNGGGDALQRKKPGA